MGADGFVSPEELLNLHRDQGMELFWRDSHGRRLSRHGQQQCVVLPQSTRGGGSEGEKGKEEGEGGKEEERPDVLQKRAASSGWPPS